MNNLFELNFSHRLLHEIWAYCLPKCKCFKFRLRICFPENEEFTNLGPTGEVRYNEISP